MKVEDKNDSLKLAMYSTEESNLDLNVTVVGLLNIAVLPKWRGRR